MEVRFSMVSIDEKLVCKKYQKPTRFAHLRKRMCPPLRTFFKSVKNVRAFMKNTLAEKNENRKKISPKTP